MALSETKFSEPFSAVKAPVRTRRERGKATTAMTQPLKRDVWTRLARESVERAMTPTTTANDDDAKMTNDAPPRLLDALDALETIAASWSDVGEAETRAAREAVLRACADASTSWSERLEAMRRAERDAGARARRREASGSGVDANARDGGGGDGGLSSVERLLALDDEEYLRAATTSTIVDPSDAPRDDIESLESELIAIAFREFTSTRRVFHAWREYLRRARVAAAREKEAESLRAFYEGRRMRRALVAIVRAWRTHTARARRVRAFTQRRRDRARGAMIRAWSDYARRANERRRLTLRRAEPTRTARTMRRLFVRWRHHARASALNARALIWRRLKLQAVCLASWIERAKELRAERAAMASVQAYRATRMKRRVFTEWRDLMRRMNTFVDMARLYIKFTTWRRVVETKKRDAARWDAAVRYDETRIKMGALCRWGARVHDSRVEREETARAVEYHRKVRLLGVFYALKSHVHRAQAEKFALVAAAFADWMRAVERARRLESRAQFYVDSLAVTFADKYLDAHAFRTWRAYALAQRRRYAAMEFCEVSRAKRAFAAWRRFPLSDRTNDGAAAADAGTITTRSDQIST